MNKMGICLCIALLLAACGEKKLQPDEDFDCDQCVAWNQPFDPFRIYGNTWYVGTDGLSSILIEADGKLLLIDAGLPQSAALIEANIRALGFDPVDIAAILVSHEHYDHVGGVNALQRLTGATVYTSAAGAAALRSGQLQPDDPQFGYGPDNTRYAAVENVVAIEDRALVSIGGISVMAVHTPGHTPGSVSWAWESCALDTCYNVVYADSLSPVSADGYRFSDGAAERIIESAGVIADLDCDILLSPHPFFFGLHDKVANREQGNPFVNSVACMMYADAALDWLQRRLESEQPNKPLMITPDIPPPQP